MAKVQIQLISDAGEIENEQTLIAGTTAQEAERIFSETVYGVKSRLSPSCFTDLVVEFHYKDGDVGAYDNVAVQSLWAQFSREREASHILIRPRTEDGQLLSNRLHAITRSPGRSH